MHAGAANAFADHKMARTVLGWLEAPTLNFVEPKMPASRRRG
jgi:hypothetical protein